MVNKSVEKYGAWAFLVGVILAVLFAFVSATWLPWVLAVIGIVIGLFNIQEKEVGSFLMAGAVLVVVSSFGGDVFGGIDFLSGILGNMLMLFVPATVVVALKSVFAMAKK